MVFVSASSYFYIVLNIFMLYDEYVPLDIQHSPFYFASKHAFFCFVNFSWIFQNNLMYAFNKYNINIQHIEFRVQSILLFINITIIIIIIIICIHRIFYKSIWQMKDYLYIYTCQGNGYRYHYRWEQENSFDVSNLQKLFAKITVLFRSDRSTSPSSKIVLELRDEKSS